MRDYGQSFRNYSNYKNSNSKKMIQPKLINELNIFLEIPKCLKYITFKI